MGKNLQINKLIKEKKEISRKILNLRLLKASGKLDNTSLIKMNRKKLARILNKINFFKN
jgi:ribosomal protein L29